MRVHSTARKLSRRLENLIQLDFYIWLAGELGVVTLSQTETRQDLANLSKLAAE